MPMADFLRQADLEAAIGLSGITGLAIRMDLQDLKPANDVLKAIVDDPESSGVLKLVCDETKLLQRLDAEGHDLVVHEVAKALGPAHDETDQFLQLNPFYLSLQDSNLNTSLHYLADNGVDVIPAVPFRTLLIRNAKGATVLHVLAKNENLRARLVALPQEVLDLKTVNGIRVSDVLNYEAPEKPTILQQVAKNT